MKPFNKHFFQKQLPVSEIVMGNSAKVGAFDFIPLRRGFFSDIVLTLKLFLTFWKSLHDFLYKKVVYKKVVRNCAKVMKAQYWILRAKKFSSTWYVESDLSVYEVLCRLSSDSYTSAVY